MGPLEITLICIAAILGAWLLIVLALSIVLAIYIHKIKRKKSSISIILAQKYDVAVVLAKYLISMNEKIPSDILADLNLQNTPDFNYYSTFERKNIGDRINDIITKLKEIGNSSSYLNEIRYITLKNSTDDVDKQYKHAILSYNNLVWGYNYWIKFIFYRPISLLFKLKEIKSIK